MKKILFAFAILMALPVSASDDWGKNGHRATGEVAEDYLTSRTRRKIDKLLDGHGLAYVSTFGDEIKSDPAYDKYGPWHYVNLEEGQKQYSPEAANPEGDLIFGIKKCIAVLEDENASKEKKQFHLKMLVHFMGDLHQPLHAGRGEDYGGNAIDVTWFGDDSNLHRVWDSEMIDDYQMSYTELAANTDELSKREAKEIASGSLLDWMYESKQLSNLVYASVEEDKDLGYRYMYIWFPVVHDQIQKGGIRLAEVLNDIFD